jgi:hypothetical protein
MLQGAGLEMRPQQWRLQNSRVAFNLKRVRTFILSSNMQA